MKKLLPILIILSALVGACKKSKTPEAPKIQDLPIITGIVPNIATAGSVVSILGSNFGTKNYGISVFCNGKPGIIQNVTPTEIKVVVPETTSGSVDLLAGGETIKGPAFTFTDRGKITSVSPNSGNVGTLVKISGTGFDGSGPLQVLFNNKPASIRSTTSTEILAVVPDTTSGNVTVKTGNSVVQGPFFNINGSAKITSISPDNGTSGIVVTLTGANFGNSVSGVSVAFNNKSATVQSVTPTEIKVLVPITTTGNVTLSINGQGTVGPLFTYNSPLATGYTGGNVQLLSQADVDVFVSLNKGKTLQITGGLAISGNDIISLAGLSNIASVNGSLSVSGSLINDLTFLNNITSLTSLTLQNLAVGTLSMNRLMTVTGAVRIVSCANLRTLSLKSLSTITGNQYLGSLGISGCPQLADINLKSLTSTTDKININGTALTDMSGFSSLKSAGALTLYNNQNLTSLRGLENLTQLTLRPLTSGLMSSQSVTNGIIISGNNKLTSLNGIQNVLAVTIASITQNISLTDLCPAKSWLNNLVNLPNYSYRKQDALGRYFTTNLPALTLTANGSYTTRADALTALALCK